MRAIAGLAAVAAVAAVPGVASAGGAETEGTGSSNVEAARACAATHTVTASSFTWDTNLVNAVPGDCLEWVWGIGGHDLWLVDSDVPLGQEGPVEENLTCPDGSCDSEPPTVREFPNAGSWDYYCKLHGGRSATPGASMSGRVIVEDGGGGDDTTAPTTTASLSPASPGPGGTYDRPVTVTLEATDDDSGVDETLYSIDGGAETPYTEPFTVSALGAHTIEFHSTDVAGNDEDPKQVTFTIEEDTTPDETPPVTTAALNPASPGPGGTYTDPVTVTLDATDDDSGVDETLYSIDGGAETPYTEPFTVSALGAHTIEFHSTDIAGNNEDPKQVAFSIQTAQEQPPPEPPPEPPRDATPPNAQPFVELEKPAKLALADFLRKGLAVEGPCSGVESGTVQLAVKKSAARKLGLRQPLLAKAKVECGVDGRFVAKLKPKGTVKKALKRASGSVKAKVTVKMGSVDDTTSATFTAAKGKR